MKNDEVYDELGQSIFKETLVANYKHLCGEYPVSTSFALWMGANIIREGAIPDGVMKKGEAKVPRKILIYNHIQQKYHTLMLIAAV